MSLKSETIMLKVCGNCIYANQRLESLEIQRLKRKAHFKQRYFPYLVLLRRYPNPLRDTEVLCRKENIKVGLLDDACAFWKSHHQRSQV